MTQKNLGEIKEVKELKNIKRYMCPSCRSLSVGELLNGNKFCIKCGCSNGDFLEV